MKTKAKFKALAIISLIFISFTFFSFAVLQQQQEEWIIPSKYKNMKNPVKPDRENLTIGKNLYYVHCVGCHGEKGKGDGSDIQGSGIKVGYITGEKFNENQTDGDIYYKSIIGRGDMPNFEADIPNEEERWFLVNFIHTLRYK